MNLKATECPFRKNKGAEQLRGNHAADQRLCFHYIDSTISLLLILKVQASSHLLRLYSPVCVGPGRKTEDRFSHYVVHICSSKNELLHS